VNGTQWEALKRPVEKGITPAFLELFFVNFVFFVVATDLFRVNFLSTS